MASIRCRLPQHLTSNSFRYQALSSKEKLRAKDLVKFLQRAVLILGVLRENGDETVLREKGDETDRLVVLLEDLLIEYIISRFTTDSQSYYDLVIKVAYTGAKQKALVLRKVDASGDRTIAVSGNKAEVGQRLMKWDVDITRAIVKPLIRDEAEFTADMVGDDPVGDDIIATTYGVNIQRRHLWEFQPGKALSTFIVAQFVRLIKADDDRLCDAHRAFGGTRPGYIEVKKSFFADPLIIGSLLSDDGILREECAAYIREQEVAAMHRIPIYSGRGTSLEIVVVHILDKT
ncbi:hypothetical protein B484DRAFT_461216, partial [Ochromonadaceae sp. CCMP2298]